MSREHLPSGTLTFLFTDIERSTDLLNRVGEDRYRRLLEDHARMVRTAVGQTEGVEVNTQGDAFFVVFQTASQAVAAALAAQRALSGHGWPEDAPVRVRMGIHTGEAYPGGDDYVGLDVHRAARIAAAAHGGQILVSGAAQAL
ncbi:MAG: adenylate/guanylate cyclase domain-containing protein, partial [Actinomycetota bacterium]|nr:adenylate/guanylate cyclase domain-containing protein [Actinomycetota bacterium]